MGAPFFLPKFRTFHHCFPKIFECKLFLCQYNPSFGSCSLPLVPATSFCVLFLSSNVLLFSWYRYHIGTTDLSCADNITLLRHFASAYWKRAFYRLSWAMRLAMVGRSWEEFGKIASLPFELISGVLGNWEIFFQLHSSARVRAWAVSWRSAAVLSSPCCARALWFAACGTLWKERGTVWDDHGTMKTKHFELIWNAWDTWDSFLQFPLRMRACRTMKTCSPPVVR